MIPNSVILALLLSAFSGTDAEDQAANSKVVESRVEDNISRNEYPSESAATTRNGVPMVGPSAEEIHDFLYPIAKDSKVVRPAN